jgi:hypothetical protein
MKIYFGFTVAGDRSSIDTARKVVHQLEEMGHEALTRHLVQRQCLGSGPVDQRPGRIPARYGLVGAVRAFHC